MPEAQLNLAHAVMYLASAPKSNSVTTALGAAMQDVRDQPAGAVPAHLRDSHYPGAAKLGTATGTCTRTTSPTDGWTSSTGPTSTTSGTGSPTGRGADVDQRRAESEATGAKPA